MGGASYKYDGEGNRIQQTVGANVIKYLLDLQPGLPVVVAETQGANTNRYIHAQRGIHAHKDAAANWEWMVQDGLGSVRGVMGNTGNVLETRQYSPYGEPFGATGSSQTPYGFTGEVTDSNSLLYLRARHYNPAQGVFTSLDPFEGLWDEPMSINGYSYVHGNPTNWTDPSGEILPVLIGATLIGGVAMWAWNTFVEQGYGVGGYNSGGRTELSDVFSHALRCSNQFEALGRALEGAELGFNIGLGYGVGAWIRYLRQAKLVTRLGAFGIGGLADIGIGTAWDMVSHRQKFEEALTYNTLGFLFGLGIEGVGEVIARSLFLGARAGRRLLRPIVGSPIFDLGTIRRFIADQSDMLEEIRWRVSRPSAFDVRRIIQDSNVPGQFSPNFMTPVGRRFRTTVSRGLSWVNDIVSGTSTRTGKVNIHTLLNDERSYTMGNQLHLEGNVTQTTVIHESGHLIEYYNPNMRQSAFDFRNERWNGRRIDLGYGEHAMHGGFINPYMGRVYYRDAAQTIMDGGTEIISMGLQYLYKYPKRLARLDPEYFDFLVLLLKGKF
jgi:RHS repeat-associated protein